MDLQPQNWQAAGASSCGRVVQPPCMNLSIAAAAARANSDWFAKCPPPGFGGDPRQFMMTQLLVQHELLKQETAKRLVLEQLLSQQREAADRQETQTPPPQSRYWTTEEHEAFLRAVELHGFKDLKRISADIKTRNMIQVRTHLQKYVQKLKRDGVESTTVPSSAKDRAFGRKRSKSTPPPAEQVAAEAENRSASCPAKHLCAKQRALSTDLQLLSSARPGGDHVACLLFNRQSEINPAFSLATTCDTVRALDFKMKEASEEPAPQQLQADDSGQQISASITPLMTQQQQQLQEGGGTALQLLDLGTLRDFAIFPELFARQPSAARAVTAAAEHVEDRDEGGVATSGLESVSEEWLL